MMDEEIRKAAGALKEGKTILYPTDTIWGIGCDATNEKAVEKVFELKQRPESKSLIVLVSDTAMLNRYVSNIPAQAWDLIEVSDSPITIIYDSPRGLAKNLLAADGSAGIRMVKPGSEGGDDFCHRLIRSFGKPIVSTSANISGAPSPQNYCEVSEEIKNNADHIITWRQDDTTPARPSSVIKLRANGEFTILRR